MTLKNLSLSVDIVVVSFKNVEDFSIECYMVNVLGNLKVIIMKMVIKNKKRKTRIRCYFIVRFCLSDPIEYNI